MCGLPGVAGSFIRQIAVGYQGKEGFDSVLHEVPDECTNIID